MSETSRRTFVSGLVAGLPTLAYAGAGAQAPAFAGTDPVWSQIMSDLQRIYGELRGDWSRRDSIRALESTVRMHAAYSAALGNGSRIQRAVAARLRNDQREFLEQAQRMSSREHRMAELRQVLPNFDGRPSGRPDPTIEELERAAAAVARGGHIPVLVGTANLLRVLAEQPRQIARVSLAARQSDLCTQMEAQIAALAFMTGMVCALTLAFPALAPECAALGATLAVMELSYWIFCTWF